MTLTQIVQVVYSISAIGLWGAVAVLAWRYARPALAIGAELVAALTLVSKSMQDTAADAQTTREATARIEGACERIEHEVRELRVLVAGRATLPSIPESEPSRRSRR